MVNLDYLDVRGYLKPGYSFLDIGSQNLYTASPQAICSFAEKFGKITDANALQKEAERISYFSTPRPGERTAYLSELLDLTELQYTSYDVCPALKTEIFDLNCEHLPKNYREKFDIVLNFGTTEHVTNQLNAFRVMHDAMKVGGITFHQIPSVGWTEHGYFCYHLTFLEDLAKANGYEMTEWWYMPAGQSTIHQSNMRDAMTPLVKNSSTESLTLPNINLNVILQKKKSSPFRVGLELATSHSALSPQAAQLYPDKGRVILGETNTGVPNNQLAEIPAKQLFRELLSRLTRTIRK